MSICRRLLSAAILLGALVPASAASATYLPAGIWPQPTYHMKSAYGVATDPSGNIYIADTGNNRVVKFGKSGGSWAWGSLGTDSRMFSQPYAIAVSPDGLHLYVADTGNHRVQKLTVNGVFEAAWGREGGPNAAGSGDKEFSSPKGICVDGAGFVYVADTGNERIQKFDKNGAFLGKWGSPGSEDGQFYEPVGIGASPSGNIYVADHDSTNYYVSCFDTSGRFIRRWGGATGSLPSQVRIPWGIAVDAAGNVYVSVQDMLRYRIAAFTGDGRPLKTWGVSGSGDYNSDHGPELYQPAGLAMLGAANQSLLMCEPSKDRIREFSLDGGTLSIRGSWGAAFGRFDTASGVAVDNGGNIVVASESGSVSSAYRMNHSAQKFSSTGQLISHAPTTTPAAPSMMNRYFDRATAVAVDSLGFAYVAEAGNSRIQKLSPNGLFYQTKWGEKGTGEGRFDSPGGVACAVVNGGGRVFVADTNNNRVQVFTSDGYFLAKWGKPGKLNGQFNKPKGIAVSPDGIVYVVDTGNNRIQYFDVMGKYLGGWGSAGKPSDPAKFSLPQGIAVGPSGEVYVCDTNNDRIKKFTAKGVPLDSWGSSGADPGEFAKPRGIAVNSTGVVYVADSANHRIQYFPPKVSVSKGVIVKASVSASPVRFGALLTVRASLVDTSGVSLAGRMLSLSTSHDGQSWSYVGSFESSTGAYAYTQSIDRKTLFRWAFAGDATYAAAEGYATATPQALLTIPSGVSSVRLYSAVALSGDLKPRHAAGSRAVTLQAYHYESGRWIYRASGIATLSNKLGFSHYAGRVALGRAGRWRIRAYHRDADHAATYAGYKYVTVK